MTEIEEQFFKTFGIEPFIYCSNPRLDCSARSEGTCKKECEYYSGILYPEITAEILLELICILNKHYQDNYQCATMLVGTTIEEVKKCILSECFENEKHIKAQVRKVFEGEE